MSHNKIRVLIVEDSFLMRKVIGDAINADPALEVIYKAKNGREGLQKILELKPDIVTLDINLPLLDGIAVLKEVMKKQPTKVIMLSAYTKEGTNDTMKALELGAIDFIAKPSGEISLDIYKLKDEIVAKIKLAGKIELNKFMSVVSSGIAAPSAKEKLFIVKKLVIIGASTGGPKVVLDIMKNIPGTDKAAFIIVQHMPVGFTTTFAERISWESKIKAKEAENNEFICAGKAYVAPAGHHLIVEKYGEHLKARLTQDPQVNFVRPSIDVTMSSAAQACGENIIGIILTGMGKDGMEGTKSIKEKGGTIIIQNEESSVVWGMPKAVSEAGLADKVLSPQQIVQEIAKAI
ncbi:MAG TPA: chemotaxis response regulator protein-glutamate methylesterase [Candidatus Omnitrophica bacterium]|nr:chemotaxis response regulator protein-glutamate methylesterase [Candidatus Omnitrophota bacterium]